MKESRGCNNTIEINIWRLNHEEISYSQFINEELDSLFKKYDCDRSIPNMIDGLKVRPSVKILYSAFKKKLYSEIKVAQFSGYVSEHRPEISSRRSWFEWSNCKYGSRLRGF